MTAGKRMIGDLGAIHLDTTSAETQELFSKIYGDIAKYTIRINYLL